MAFRNLDIVKRIKAARMHAGLTQKELATNLGRTSAAISDLERGKVQVSAIDLFKLSRLLKKPIEYFYGEDLGDDFTQELIAGIREMLPDERYAIVPVLRNILRIRAIVNELPTITDQEKGRMLVQELLGLIQLVNRQFGAVAEEGQDLEKILQDFVPPVFDPSHQTKTKKTKRGE